MSYTLEFQLPGLPKKTNDHKSSSWKARMGEARKWKTLVIYAVGYRAPAKPLQKAKLTLTRVSGTRPDFDGLVSGFKHIIDGLIEAKVLLNDKHENVGQPEYLWEKGKLKHGYVIVKIEEIPEL